MALASALLKVQSRKAPTLPPETSAARRARVEVMHRSDRAATIIRVRAMLNGGDFPFLENPSERAGKVRVFARRGAAMEEFITLQTGGYWILVFTHFADRPVGQGNLEIAIEHHQRFGKSIDDGLHKDPCVFMHLFDPLVLGDVAPHTYDEAMFPLDRVLEERRVHAEVCWAGPIRELKFGIQTPSLVLKLRFQLSPTRRRIRGGSFEPHMQVGSYYVTLTFSQEGAERLIDLDYPL